MPDNETREALRIGIVSQSRMTSSRLPGKIFKEAAGKPLLQHHIERLQKSGYPVYIATTNLNSDDPVVDFCETNNIPYFRGSETDVLSRFSGLIEQFDLDIVCRVTSDCPLIDGDLIRQGIQKFLAINKPHIYVSNCIERTYPRGFDFEIFWAKDLLIADYEAKESSHREHVTPYLYRKGSPIELINIKGDSDKSRYRVTVDEIADFNLIKILIEEHSAFKLSSSQITEILDQHPELVALNSGIEQKKI